MKPWSTLAQSTAPDGAALLLQQRGTEFAIRADGQVLMGSRATGSEQALAEATCSALPVAARVLVGGLGMGFTLRAALDRLGPKARVHVAELVPDIVAWNRGTLAPLAGHPLDDPRVHVHQGDVRAVWKTEGRFDAILLDVDNGPTALTRPSNRSLYSPTGVREAFAAIHTRGVLGVWSAGPAPEFLQRMQGAGFSTEQRPVPPGKHEVLLGWKRGRRRG